MNELVPWLYFKLSEVLQWLRIGEMGEAKNTIAEMMERIEREKGNSVQSYVEAWEDKVRDKTS